MNHYSAAGVAKKTNFFIRGLTQILNKDIEPPGRQENKFFYPQITQIDAD